MSNEDISVIIPVYNDVNGIETTLSCLVNQTVPRDRYEVIPVDNGSTDETSDVIEQFASENPELVRPAEENENQGSYAARNRGIKTAAGEILAFLDADMEVGPEYVEKIADRMADGEVSYLGCAVELFVPEGESGWVAQYDSRTAFPIEEYITEQQFCPTCSLVVRKDVFDAVGPFDDRFKSGGDAEFGNRVADAGFELAYEPEIVARHPARTDLKSVLKKELRVGFGICQQQVYYPSVYGKPGIPPKPSGAKSSDRDVQDDEVSGRHLNLIAALSICMTLTRGMGYGIGLSHYVKQRLKT